MKIANVIQRITGSCPTTRVIRCRMPVPALGMATGRLKERETSPAMGKVNGAALHRTGERARREHIMEVTGNLILEIPLWHMAILLVILIVCLGYKKCAAG